MLNGGDLHAGAETEAPPWAAIMQVDIRAWSGGGGGGDQIPDKGLVLHSYVWLC